MSMRNAHLATAAVLALALHGASAAEAPHLGQPATPDEIASYDIDVEPDGSGLPPGSGTPKQGEAVYVEKCQSCHGEKGVHGPALALAGGEGTIGKVDVKPLRTIGSYWPYATSVFAYIRRAMPFYDTKTLSNAELYAVTAYLLNINHIIGDNDVMNAATLPKVVMPWRDHFRPFVRGD
ncbi:MAG TPA: cytochrome c [Beijerinckiaceae bacterium]|nr:cytochrome c [Beijerinckiaceae bacterium]